MVRASVKDVAQDFAGYLNRVAAGETVLITQADLPIAEIKPVSQAAGTERPFGLCAGEFTLSDDFDAPLPDEILNDFDGR